MRTHNLTFIAAVFLVFGGLFSSFWLQKSWEKPEFIEERAVSGAVSAFVSTAWGANLDASVVTLTTNAAFSSLDGVSGFTGSTSSLVDSTDYSSGAVKDPGYSSFSR